MQQPAPAEKIETTKVLITLPKNLHVDLRVRAIKEGKTFSSLAQEIIERFCNEQNVA